MPDGTKVLIALDTLPANTNPNIRLGIKGINVHATFEDALRDNSQLPEEHRGVGGGGAHRHTGTGSRRQPTRG